MPPPTRSMGASSSRKAPSRKEPDDLVYEAGADDDQEKEDGEQEADGEEEEGLSVEQLRAYTVTRLHELRKTDGAWSEEDDEDITAIVDEAARCQSIKDAIHEVFHEIHQNTLHTLSTNLQHHLERVGEAEAADEAEAAESGALKSTRVTWTRDRDEALIAARIENPGATRFDLANMLLEHRAFSGIESLSEAQISQRAQRAIHEGRLERKQHLPLSVSVRDDGITDSGLILESYEKHPELDTATRLSRLKDNPDFTAQYLTQTQLRNHKSHLVKLGKLPRDSARVPDAEDDFSCRWRALQKLAPEETIKSGDVIDFEIVKLKATGIKRAEIVRRINVIFAGRAGSHRHGSTFTPGAITQRRQKSFDKWIPYVRKQLAGGDSPDLLGAINDATAPRSRKRPSYASMVAEADSDDDDEDAASEHLVKSSDDEGADDSDASSSEDEGYEIYQRSQRSTVNEDALTTGIAEKSNKTAPRTGPTLTNPPPLTKQGDRGGAKRKRSAADEDVATTRIAKKSRSNSTTVESDRKTAASRGGPTLTTTPLLAKQDNRGGTKRKRSAAKDSSTSTISKKAKTTNALPAARLEERETMPANEVQQALKATGKAVEAQKKARHHGEQLDWHEAEAARYDTMARDARTNKDKDKYRKKAGSHRQKAERRYGKVQKWTGREDKAQKKANKRVAKVRGGKGSRQDSVIDLTDE